MASQIAAKQSPELCPRCRAPFSASDRFCSVCGATRSRPEPAGRPARRGFWLLLGSATCLALVFAVVALIYFTAPERRATRPHSTIPSGPPLAVLIVPGSPPTNYVGTALRIFVSRDQASSWQPAGEIAGISALAVSTDPPYVVYAGGVGLWQADGNNLAKVGASLPPGGIRAIAIDPQDSRRLVAATDGKGLIQSDDAGQTWALVGDNAPAGITGLAFGGGASRTLYAGTAADGVFASPDGRSWTNASGFVNGALPTRNVTALASDNRSGDRYVGPNGQTMTGALYAGTNLGIFKSIDGGVSWSPLPFHQPIVALAVAPDGSHGMLAVDGGGGVYRSSDGGATWN